MEERKSEIKGREGYRKRSTCGIYITSLERERQSQGGREKKGRGLWFLIKTVMWTRIRSDPHSFGSVDRDPDYESGST